MKKQLILESPRNTVLQQDTEELQQLDIPFGALEGKSVFVTGATGLIGSQIVKALACVNRIRNLNIQIIALARSTRKAAEVFGDLLQRPDLKLLIGDVKHPLVYEGDIHYIIHAASPTSSRFFVTNPVETIEISVYGTKNVLELAKTHNVESMVYLSSLEVYGVPEAGRIVTAETDYGYLDPLQIRSSYSEGKRLAECLCCSYAAEYGIPVKIARLSQTFGAGVEYNDSRVFAEFARCAIEKKNIVLHTPGNTVRTYCYTKDAIAALFFVLLRGTTAEAYNVTNMNTKISIRDMAQLVCDIFREADIKVQFDCRDNLQEFGYNPEMVILLDNTKLKALGWKETVDLPEMFARLIKSMKEVSAAGTYAISGS